MTIVFTDQERRRRRKMSASKATGSPRDPRTVQPSQSSIHVQQQASAPAIEVQDPHGYTTSPQPLYSYPPAQEQYHPIYGPTPQMPQQYRPPYPSHADQSSQQFVGSSTVTFTEPAKQNSNLLRTHWDRAERLASRSCDNLSNQIGKSVNKSMDMTNKGVNMMTSNLIVKPTTLATKKSVQALNQGAALCDRISDKFDAVLTSIDGGLFSGNEQDLYVYEDPVQNASTATFTPSPPQIRTAPVQSTSSTSNKTSSKGSNFFSKVWLYSNSRLPPHLPPFKVYMPTYPLICLAATYSERAYNDPTTSPSESETHIKADWRSGTKAMVLKSLPIDDMNTIVFAIRGSQTFMDWAVNYRSEPTSPEGFLDDPGNLCHAGFLYVARKMVKPVAERLRVLLQENPSRSNASLLITGHSAGGAVAALLFAHMMNIIVQSELSYLTGFFKRIHCVTFGAPPVSLLPLKKSRDPQHRKSLFYSFINEGDPVPRADRAVVKSLLKLYTTPAPNYSCSLSNLANMSMLNISSSNPSQSTFQTTTTATTSSKPSRPPNRFCRPSKTSLKTNSTSNTTATTTATLPSYPIVPGSLSPAGRLIVLRHKPNTPGGFGGPIARITANGEERDIEAVVVEDDVLRTVVYGDPVMHMMRVYQKRVEGIAVKAVTGAGW